MATYQLSVRQTKNVEVEADEVSSVGRMRSLSV